MAKIPKSRKNRFTKADLVKWTAIAGFVGGLLAQVLPSDKIEQMGRIAETGESVLTAILGLLVAFLISIRKK